MPGYFDAPRYPARRVPEQDGVAVTHPVVIVGAGPVGMTLALCLARQGVRTVLLEAGDRVGFGSRAICVSARSLEILDQVGAAQRVLDIAVPWTGGRTYYHEHQIGSFTMAAHGDRPPMVNIQQSLLEQVLVDRIDAEPLVDLRWHCRLTGIEQDADTVALAVAAPGGDHTVHARWAVACDGPRSPVREMLGLTLHGESHEGRYVIVDLLMRSERPAERLCWFDPPTFPGKTVLLHKQPHDIWRLDYQIDAHETLEAATDPDRVLPLVEAHLAWMGETAPWTVDWLSSYRAHSLTLDDYRLGRILFAGDAAHLVPIFGVRGLNGGLVDALNLSWKLAAVTMGAVPELLDSYSGEQRAAAVENMTAAATTARFMSPETPARVLLRDAVLSLAVSHPRFRSLTDPRQTTPVDYPDSPLSTPDSDAWAGGPAPGALAPDMPVGDSTLARTAGLGFVLLALGGATAPEAGSIPVIAVDDPQVAARFDAERGGIYLLRPDRHVAARWRTPTADEVAAARRLAGGERVDAHVS